MSTRKLWPTGNEKPSALTPRNQSFNLTEDAYNAIIEAIEAVNTRVTNTDSDLQAYKDALASEITSHLGTFDSISVTDRADIVNAVVDTLTATSATIPTLNSNDVTTVDLTAQRAAIDEIVNVTSADIATVNATTVNADEGNFTSLHVDSFDAEHYQIDQAAISDFTSEIAQVEDLTAVRANVDNLTASETTTTTLEATNAVINESSITDDYSRNIYNHYFNHNKIFNRQIVSSASISADDDCYIVLPKFKNGTYYLIAKNGDNGPFLWSLEIENSIRNISFRWSNASDEVQYLKDVDFINDEYGHQFIQIHFNTNGLATHIWHQCTDYETQTPPSMYDRAQYTGDSVFKHFDITRNHGIYLPNAVFAGEFHADSIEIDDVHFDEVYVNHSIQLPNAYDQYGEALGYTRGLPGQYITNKENDNNFDELEWKEPVDNRVPTDANETRTLITEATLGNYTGRMLAEKITETVDTYSDVLTDGSQFIKVEDNYYPILGKQTIPAYRDEYNLNSLTQEEADQLVATGLCYNDGTDYIQITEIDVVNETINGTDFSSDWATMKVYSEEHPETYYITYNGDEHVASFPLTVYVNNGEEYNIVHTGDGTVVHGDATINNDLDVKRDAHIERDAVVDKDTSIGGDLTVATVWTDPEDSSITKENKVRLPNIYNGPASQEPNNMPDDSLIISNGSHTETTTTTVYTDGTNFYDENGTATTEPSGTAGTPTVIGNFVLDANIWYQKVSDTWYEVDDFIDNTNWTEVTDSELIAILDAATTVEVSSVVYTESTTVNDGAKLMRKSSFAIGGVVTAKKDEIAARNSDYSEVVDGETVHWDDMDAKPLIWNKDRNAIQPTNTLDIGDVAFDDLTVRGKATVAETLDVTGTTRIGGDLYVSGTSHIVDEEHISTTGDLVTLRQNAETGLLPGQVSGLIINNYKEDDQHNPVDLALVTDETGTLRVGTGSGISTDYTKIAWKEADAKWYSYDDTDPDDIQYTLMSPQPSGTVTDYTGKTEKDPYTLYATATFTVIDKTTLEPMLTRDEEANLSDQAILKWDADGTKAKTIPLPTINGQKLVGTITVDDTDPLNPVTTYGYEWGGTSDPSVFRFATVEAYETALLIPEGQAGYIPDGSIILIDGNYNMEMGV